MFNSLVLRSAIIVAACASPAFSQPDACADAQLIPVPGTYSGTTLGSTNDGGNSCSGFNDVWYRVTPSANQILVVSTCTGATWDTVLAVHSGCPATQSNLLLCADDFCQQQTNLELPVIAGNTYYIRVCGFSGVRGPFTLRAWYEDQPFPGPDVIVGDIQSMISFNAVDGVMGFAIGATSCNVGTADANWYANDNRHPLVAQSFYRLRNRRFEQVGISWLKHTFGTVDDGICGTCNGHLGQVLGVGCSDPYDAGTNGFQQILGPRWQINPTTGEYPYPFANPPYSGSIARRLQVPLADIDPAQNPNARYFAEVHYITSDDAPAGNGLNNASYREVSFPAPPVPRFVADVHRRSPAILAWRDADPNVVVVNVDYTESGLAARFIVAARTNDLGNSTWSYEYAVYNHNSNRAARAFELPMPASGPVSNVGFHDIFYHSGDGINNVTTDGTDWANSQAGDALRWETQTYAQDPNANALRWGTLYNFRFTANVPPTTGDATLTLFKPGSKPGEPLTVTAVGLPVPTGNPPCVPDWNHDHSLTSQDFFDFLADFFQSNADFNSNGVTNSQDFFDYVAAFFNGC